MTTGKETSMPWMDRSWMQNVLRGVENDESLSITDYHVRDSSSKGDHYLSEIHRITIHLQRAGSSEIKMSLIAKKFPPGEGIQNILNESTAYPNEMKMFKQVLPKLQAILETAAPGKHKSFAARHIYSQNDSPYFLIVSDLAAEGFRMAERQRGLDLDHCLLVMRTLGRYHAVCVALHESDPQHVESFTENAVTEDSCSGVMKFRIDYTVTSLAKVVRSWPEDGEMMADKLLSVADACSDQLRRQYSPKGNRLNVLTHGDLWINNILFKYNDADGLVEDVRFVDFQLSRYASCAIDLQHFIHTSPRDDVRASHTEDLLREYHGELCSTLRLTGQAHSMITFQELMEEYEEKGLFGFFMSLLALPIVMADAADVTDFEAITKKNYQSELYDKRLSNKDYVQVMKRLLPIFQKKGYF